MGTNTWLFTTTYYDKKGRVIQTIGDNHLGGYDRTSTEYDFAGRLTNTWHKVGEHEKIEIVAHRYDDRGQLNTLGVTEDEARDVVVQHVQDYYRNTWLNTVSNDDDDDLFAMDFDYTTANAFLNASAQYNGNISAIQWHVRGKEIQEYGFQYDNLNRLTNATYGEKVNGQYSTFKANGYNMSANYDLNGNIQTLQRKGAITLNANKEATAFGIIDNLGYTYHNNSNQLKAVSDIGSSSTVADLKGFKDGNTTNTDYIYDANGNMTEDKNKDIIIEYNHLNLPNKVTFGNGNKLEWDYDAAGIKLTKIATDNQSNITTKNYAGGFEYSNGALEAIYFSEGRVADLGGGAYRYEYSLKDHLGNTRITFADINNDGKVEESEILQEEHYYPFGLRMEGYGRLIQDLENAYNYNGKELNADFDLDWLDYGARWYDASIARWSAVDPLAEKAPNWTPYRYGFNNPMKFIDPDGQFESAGAARKHAKQQGIKLGWCSKNKIIKNTDGTWSIDNKKNKSSIFEDKEFGILTSALVSFPSKPKIGNTGRDDDSDGDRRSRWRESNNSNALVFDQRGTELFGRWLNGSGKTLNVINGQWGEYMKANELLAIDIPEILSQDANTRTTNGNFSYTGHAEIQNGYSTGYEMLHGTNSTVGGFQIYGTAEIIDANTVVYKVRMGWHDIIDPNPFYEEDKSYVEIFETFYSPKDYIVHIYWEDQFTIKK